MRHAQPTLRRALIAFGLSLTACCLILATPAIYLEAQTNRRGGLAVGFDETCAGLGPCQQTVTLTNAQIKALPTTPVDLVTAPGAGYRLQFIAADLELDASAGVYTNVDTTNAYLVVSAEDEEIYFSNYVYNYMSVVDLTYLLSNAHRQVTFSPYSQVIGSMDAAGLGNLATPITYVGTENKKLQLILNNNGMGNLTGGDAANHGRIIVEYRKIPVL